MTKHTGKTTNRHILFPYANAMVSYLVRPESQKRPDQLKGVRDLALCFRGQALDGFFPDPGHLNRGNKLTISQRGQNRVYPR